MELWRVYMLLKDLKGIETFTERERGIKGSFLPHLLFSYHNTFNSLHPKLLWNVFSKTSALNSKCGGFFSSFLFGWLGLFQEKCCGKEFKILQHLEKIFNNLSIWI